MLGVKLWLVQAHPLMATFTPHDDLLFVSQANNILKGKWLGEYSQLTLIKGQFYPIFIALRYYLGVPLLLSQQLLYALAAVTAVWAIAPLVSRKWILLLGFALLILNPFSYNYPAVGRVLRLGIYAPLGLLVFSTFLGMVVRSSKRLWIITGWSLYAGISLAAFWNTREESIWIAPSLVILYLPLLHHLRRYSWSEAAGRLVIYGLPLVILFGADAVLVSKNGQAYGVPAKIELETPEFKSAYGGLLRIKTDDWLQHYPVHRTAREKAYQVSPAFREIEPFLEGSVGQRWMNLCQCTDLPAAFFIWAFRGSVAAAGYYDNGPETLDFYRRMGNEIDQACNDGTIECRPRITSLVPAWHQEYNRLLFPEFMSVLWQIVTFRDFSASTEGMLSKGKAETMHMFEVVTGERVLTSKPEVMRSYPEYHTHLNEEKKRILEDIGVVYKLMMPTLFLISVAGFLFSSARGIYRKSISIQTMAAASSLAGVLSIAFILTLVKITSYTEIERAMHSAYAVLLIFIIMTFLDLLCLYRTARENNFAASQV